MRRYKRCSRCEETKTAPDDFYKDRSRSDGLTRLCRDCSKAETKSRYVFASKPEPRPCKHCGSIHQRRSEFCSKRCANHKWDRAKVLTGKNRLRMQRRAAANIGLTVEEYLARKEQRRLAVVQARAEREARTWRDCKCVECGAPFSTRISNQVCCSSEECRRRHNSKTSAAWTLRKYHSDPEFRDRWLARTHARRADKLGLGSLRVTLSYLLERDGWQCGICQTRIRTYRDASLDHIVPLADGGEHVLANVQAAHRRCNYSKGARGGNEQLLLVG